MIFEADKEVDGRYALRCCDSFSTRGVVIFFGGKVKQFLALVALSLSICVQITSAQTATVSDSYLSEVAPLTRSSVIAPDSQERAFEGFTGFYQGQFELKNVKEHPQVSCTALSSYPAELFIVQERRKIRVETPSNVSLKGRVRKGRNRRFRAVVFLTDGTFIRKVKIRGRMLPDNGSARIVSTEKVRTDDEFDGQWLCTFIHRSVMTRVSK